MYILLVINITALVKDKRALIFILSLGSQDFPVPFTCLKSSFQRNNTVRTYI